MRVSFDRFILDSDQRLLLSGDKEARLAPKAFDLLTLLIEERPKALSKDDMFQRLWPGTFVTENTLATAISDLRTALGDDANRGSIERLRVRLFVCRSGNVGELSRARRGTFSLEVDS